MRHALGAFCFLLLWHSAAWAAIVPQNISVTPLDPRIEYVPADAWSFLDSPTGNSTIAVTGIEDASLVFSLNVSSTAFFWVGYLPETAARYSICIDCTSEIELGDVVTVDAMQANSTLSPVVLFASGPLANTTHTVVLRNIREPTEGVVGDLSMYRFLYTSDVSVDSIPPPPTSNKGLIIAIAVFAPIAAIVLGVMTFFLCRYYQRRSGHTRRRSQRPGRQKGDIESVPIIEAASSTKPRDKPDTKSPLSKALTRAIERVTEKEQPPSSKEPPHPVITVTSPTTVPTSASTYSTMPDVPLPPPELAKSNQAHRTVRESDPYVNYAAAYATFAGVNDYDQPRTSSQPSAIRESVTLPCLAQGPSDSARSSLRTTSNASPTSFKPTGIRSGVKGKRTLSDKIRRGTLPPPPLESRTSILSARQSGSIKPATVMLSSQEKETSRPGSRTSSAMRPSLLPGSSPRSSPRPMDSELLAETVPTPEIKTLAAPTPAPVGFSRSSSSSVQLPSFAAETSQRQQYGDRTVPESVDTHMDAGASRSSQDTIEARKSLQGRPSTEVEPSRSRLDLNSSDKYGENGDDDDDDGTTIEGEGMGPAASQNFTRAAVASIITNRTTNTARSSYSFTPSVSEFPLPPFNAGASPCLQTLANVHTTGYDVSTSNSPSTSTPNLTRPPSSTTSTSDASSGRSGRPTSPPSSYPVQQRKPRLPPSKAAQLGLGVPAPSRTKGLVRRSSSKSSRRGRLDQLKGMSKMPFRGDMLPSSPKARQFKAQDTEGYEKAESIFSTETGESENFLKGTVPFYMGPLAAKSSSAVSDAPDGEPSLNSSRLTIGSTFTTITTTDEDYVNGAQVMVATRSIPPNVPRAIKQISPKTASPLAISIPSPRIGTASASSPAKPTSILTPDAESPYRPEGPDANVPVSAFQSEFDRISLDAPALPSQLGPGTGRTFDSNHPVSWFSGLPQDTTPSPAFYSPVPSTFDGSPHVTAPLSLPQRPSPGDASPRSNRSILNGSPRSGTGSVSSSDSRLVRPSDAKRTTGRKPSRASIIAKSEPGWKDLVSAAKPPAIPYSNARTNHNSFASTYSNTSSFFGGRSSPPSLPFPLNTPLPNPPEPSPDDDILGQSAFVNLRQGWHRPLPSQSPTTPRSQRKTSSIAYNVNTVFSTAGSSLSRPALRIQRVDGSAAGALSEASPASTYSASSPSLPLLPLSAKQ